MGSDLTLPAATASRFPAAAGRFQVALRTSDVRVGAPENIDGRIRTNILVVGNERIRGHLRQVLHRCVHRYRRPDRRPRHGVNVGTERLPPASQLVPSRFKLRGGSNELRRDLACGHQPVAVRSGQPC